MPMLNPVSEVRPGIYEVATSDENEADNRLQVFIGGNGDYYIGSHYGSRFSTSAVQIAGVGAGKTNTRLLLAVAELYRALQETAGKETI